MRLGPSLSVTGAAPVALPPLNLVFEGDSLTYGTGSTAGNDWPSLLCDRLAADGYAVTKHNNAQGGGTIDGAGGSYSVSGNAAADDALLDATKRNYLFLMVGYNDLIARSSQTPSTLQPLVASYVAARVAAGWNVIVCTQIANFQSEAAESAYRLVYNSWIRSTYGVNVVDFAAEGNVGAWPRFVSPFTDNSLPATHPNNAGYAAMAARAYVDSRRIFGQAAKTAVSSVGPSTFTAGDSVSIYGAGFTGATAVAFNGVAATSFAVISDTRVDAVVPSASSGSVTVTSPAGTGTSPYSCTYSGATYNPWTGVSGIIGWEAGTGAYSDAGTTPAADGNGVYQWSGASAGTPTASQPTAGNRPTYVASGVGGRPAIRYTSTSSQVLTLASSVAVPSKPWAIVAVVSRAAGKTLPLLGTSGSPFFGPRSNNSLYLIDDGGAVHFATYSPTSAAAGILYRVRSAQSQPYLTTTGQGVTSDSGDLIGTTATMTNIGRWGSNYGNGDVSMVALVPSELGDVALTRLLQWAEARWGVSIP